MAKQKQYVKIQSSVNIKVTCGLECKDMTNHDSDIPNRLKVSAEWPKCAVLVKAGAHWYPATIVDWPTVRALADKGILTIGEYADDKGDCEQEAESFERIVEQVKEDSKPRGLEDAAK